MSQPTTLSRLSGGTHEKEESLNAAPWFVAGLLAAGFLSAGPTKLYRSRESLAKAPGPASFTG